MQAVIEKEQELHSTTAALVRAEEEAADIKATIAALEAELAGVDEGDDATAAAEQLLAEMKEAGAEARATVTAAQAKAKQVKAEIARIARQRYNEMSAEREPLLAKEAGLRQAYEAAALALGVAAHAMKLHYWRKRELRRACAEYAKKHRIDEPDFGRLDPDFAPWSKPWIGNDALTAKQYQAMQVFGDE